MPVARRYLARALGGGLGEHGQVSDVELDDDMRWCPFAYGATVQAAVAIERKQGVVTVTYPVVLDKTRGTEYMKVISLVGRERLVYSSRDN
jgi:hypothetical protein